MPNYGDATYWDERYAQSKNSTFDWLESWLDIQKVIEQNALHFETDKDEELRVLRSKTNVLNLGCGNSILCEDMYDEGYSQISNMDISSVCIETMKNRN